MPGDPVDVMLNRQPEKGSVRHAAGDERRPSGLDGDPHANTPRDALSRLERTIGMAGLPMTIASIMRPNRRRHPRDRGPSGV